MAYEFSKNTNLKLAVIQDTIKVNSPACFNARTDLDTVERGDGEEVLIEVPDSGEVVSGSVLSDDTAGSIKRGNKKSVTFAQDFIPVIVSATDQYLDFKDDKDVLGMRASKLASVKHKRVCERLLTSAGSISVVAGDKAFIALGYASGIIKKHEGMGVVGILDSMFMADTFSESSKLFLPNKKSEEMFSLNSLGNFASAEWYQTSDIEDYDWTNGLTLGAGTTLKGSVTFTNGKATQVVFTVSGGTATLTGTLQKNTPFKLAGLKTTSLLGNATGIDATLFSDALATAAGNSLTVDLTQPLYLNNGQNFQNCSAKANISTVDVTFPLTSGKSYRRAVVYAKMTNLFRQSPVGSIIGAEVRKVGDTGSEINLTLTMDGDVKGFKNIMRLDSITAHEVAYTQLVHTVFVLKA